MNAWMLTDSMQMIVYLMLSLAFFVGIMLVVSQEAFHHFNDALRKEYGIRQRFFRKLEDNEFHFVDWLILRYRLLAGILISVSAFVLLLIYK